MGEVEVPRDALFGAQTRRALDNFPVSELRKPRRFVQALAAIKLEAANVNHELGLLDEEIKDAIVEAAEEVVDGVVRQQFVDDVFPTAPGNSTNMRTPTRSSPPGPSRSRAASSAPRSTVTHNDHVNYGHSLRTTLSPRHPSPQTHLHPQRSPDLRTGWRCSRRRASREDGSRSDDVVNDRRRTGRTPPERPPGASGPAYDEVPG
jgi:hypothetical protein